LQSTPTGRHKHNVISICKYVVEYATNIATNIRLNNGQQQLTNVTRKKIWRQKPTLASAIADAKWTGVCLFPPDTSLLFTIPDSKECHNITIDIIVKQFAKEFPVINFIECLTEVNKANEHMTITARIVVNYLFHCISTLAC
jgi:hypothetical protein